MIETLTQEQKDEKYMREAMREAQRADQKGEIPVGAVIVCQDKIIARAHNLTQLLQDPTAHAEMQAITSATSYLGAKYLTDCTLYVTLEPCTMCAGALYWSQISRIVYAAGDEKRGYRTAAPNALHPQTKVECGLCSQESTTMLQEFFRKRR